MATEEIKTKGYKKTERETFVKHSSYLFYPLLLSKGKNSRGRTSQAFMELSFGFKSVVICRL